MKKWIKSINVYTRKLFVYKFVEKGPYCGETEMIEAYQSAYGVVTAVNNGWGGIFYDEKEREAIIYE